MKNKKKVSELFDALKSEFNMPFEIAIIEECERKLNSEMPRVKNIDENTQEFNGHIYRKSRQNGRYQRTEQIHIAVMEYFSGSIISDMYEVHHATKNNEGNFDKSKNNIEDLKLLTIKEHRKIHTPKGKPVAKLKNKNFVCEYCGKEYQTLNNGQNKFCSVECRNRWHYIHNLEDRICILCGKHFMTSKYSKAKYCSASCAATIANQIRKLLKNKIQ